MGGKHKRKYTFSLGSEQPEKNRHSKVENINRTLSPSDKKKLCCTNILQLSFKFRQVLLAGYCHYKQFATFSQPFSH